MYYVDDKKNGLLGVVDTTDCIKEYISESTLVSLGYPNNPVFIDKRDLGKLGTTCDKPALKKIISEAKTSNYDVDLFNGIMIPSFSAEYYHLTFHKILKLFNYWDTDGFVILAIEAHNGGSQHGIVLLCTDGSSYNAKYFGNNINLAPEYPCASGSLYNRLDGVDLPVEDLYVRLVHGAVRSYVDVLNREMPMVMNANDVSYY